MKKYSTPEELLKMDIELDKLSLDGTDADGLAARTEIIPVVSKEDEAFLLNEDALPDELPLLPIRDNVMFPGVVMPIGVSRKRSFQLLRMAVR